jgi:hypothetical protein
MTNDPFDSLEILSADMPADLGRLRRSEPPFAKGETADRHRALIAAGSIIRRGSQGVTVFDFAGATLFRRPDEWL